MPKSSQKAAGADRQASQRGKSRFGASVRPARVVLPERPPRAVDNEIVSILLGADPAALATQAEGVKSEAPATPVAVPAAVVPVEAQVAPVASPTDGPTGAEQQPAVAPSSPAGQAQRVQPARTIIEGEGLAADEGTFAEAAEASLPAPPELAAPSPARPRRAALAPTARRGAEVTAPAVNELAARDGAVTSFEEFAERWKHGLRKGQLKICEVLYQKTYAVGQTECVTSFSELGRLSGLKMRQCFNIIAQLEALRFVERYRSASTSNKKDQGSVIRFHLYPVQ